MQKSTLYQLIYLSCPVEYSDQVVNQIMLTSFHHNGRNEITGALLHRSDAFLQLLEGHTQAVMESFVRIKKDSRHSKIIRLATASPQDRLFDGWAMFDAGPWLNALDEDVIRIGGLDAASQSNILQIFYRLASEMESDQRRFYG